MIKSLYLAGVGGQGLQVAGKTLVEVAFKSGSNVSYSPKYGIEKRGGLTSCYVVISDKTIGNPRKKLHAVVLAMEPKAYKSFRNDVEPGGVLIVNSSLVKDVVEPAPSVTQKLVPFHDICLALGSTKVISAVALGALTFQLSDLFPDPEVPLDEMLIKLKKKPELAELNRKAFYEGYNAMKAL